MTKYKTKGFTLVEIMIVIGIISILATISIPNLIRVRKTTAENKMINWFGSLHTAMNAYNQVYNSYPPTSGSLYSAVPPFLSEQPPPDYNYLFSGCAGGPCTSYSYTAVDKTNASQTFRINQTGQIQACVNIAGNISCVPYFK